MVNAPFAGAVVYTARSDVASVFRTELRSLKVEPLTTPEGPQRCIEDISTHGEALLILDWQVGADKAFQVLEAVRNPLRAAIRSVFLFSAEAINGIDGVAAEYGVIHLHIGEITRNIIKNALTNIIKAEGYPQEIQEGLRMVADVRNRGDWPAAAMILKGLKSKYPDNARVATDFAQNSFHLGDLEEARDALGPFCQKDPVDPRALNLLGRLQLRMGEFEEASVTLQRAKLINPFHIDRLCNLGDAYLNIHKFERAEINFRSAIDLGSKDPKAIGGLGKSLLLGDKINEGLVFLKQLSGNREMASVFNSAAVLGMRAGRFADGMKLYHVALDTIIGESAVLSKLAFNMGVGFIRQQNLAKAALCFAIGHKMDKSNKKAERNWTFLENKLGLHPELPDTLEGQIEMLKGIKVELTKINNDPIKFDQSFDQGDQHIEDDPTLELGDDIDDKAS